MSKSNPVTVTTVVCEAQSMTGGSSRCGLLTFRVREHGHAHG